MITKQLAVRPVIAGLRTRQGRVLAIERGEILVENESDGAPAVCRFLRLTSAPPPIFKAGAWVVYLSNEDTQRGYVVGVIEDAADTPPAHCSLEASQSLELRCGAARVALRADGQVLIRGSDVTSRASRTNKIKGAAVNIN